MGKRIFITGVTGFVGTWLARGLQDHWPDATLLDGEEIGGPGLDVNDADAVNTFIGQSKPDVVVHLAAQPSARRNDPNGVAETWQTNLVGSINVAMATATHCPEATVLFASSSEVYGASFAAGFVNEQTACVPMHAYAHSKLLAEQAFACILPHTAQLLVARPFNHTGPGQSIEFVLPNFALQIANIEAGTQSPSISVGNINVQRDFLDVRDVVRAYIVLLQKAEQLPRRFMCNIATGHTTTLRDLVEILQELSTLPFAVTIDPARLRTTDLSTIGGRADLIQAATGWTPQVDIRSTLLALLEHARQKVATG